jgi:hypothetical protein
MEKRLLKTNQAQVTIFIIVAILIVAGVILYFSLRTGFKEEIPQNIKPVYDYYLSCIEENARQGVSLLGEQAGYLDLDRVDFVPGSQYMPFSSQLDFFGQPVPYWMYVSGNNLLKEQVPTKLDMEEQLEEYIEQRVDICDFSDFESRDFDVLIDSEDVDVVVEINEQNVDVKIYNEFFVSSDVNSVFVNEHDVSINSKLGKFYDLALKVYGFEKRNMFLEKYALDVLRLYAPVDGVEISCSPKVFVESEIRQDLAEAMSVNINALKLKGDYYDLKSKESEYFVTDIGENIDENVNFIYSPLWTTRIEIYGDKIVEPVGLQQGLGILGFCYVPYHLVYDFDFPVLIQFYNEEEIFQFPISVIIDKNQAREALPSKAGSLIESEVCKYKNQDISVYTYDSRLNPVEARISFKCINTECHLGQSEIIRGDAVLREKAPKCVNGFLIASAEGYADAKYQISTNKESIADIILKKKYKVSLDLGDVEKALVRFKSNDYSASVLYPDLKNIELVEDYYNVSVYVYKASSLKIPGFSQRKCVNIPAQGILGFFGSEQEKCFDIEIPETDVESAVVGGGRKLYYYISEDELEDSRELNINIPLFDIPSSLKELQENYLAAEDSEIYLEFE